MASFFGCSINHAFIVQCLCFGREHILRKLHTLQWCFLSSIGAAFVYVRCLLAVSLEFLLETGRGPFLLIAIIRMYTVLRLPGGLWNEVVFTLLYTPVRYSVFPCGSDFLIYSGLPSR